MDQGTTLPPRTRRPLRGACALGPALALLALVLGTSSASAVQLDEAWAKGLSLEHGQRVEGSQGHGGLQPDYLIDLEHPSLAAPLRRAAEIGRSKRSVLEKAEAISTYVRERVLLGRAYDEPVYLSLLSRYRKRGQPVPIGEYARVGAGVCRENAMLVHLMLERAGIDSRYLYVQSEVNGFQEDHAVVLVRQGRTTWMVDSFNPLFQGRRVKDALRATGLLPRDPKAPALRRSDDPVSRRIVRMHDFPKVSRFAGPSSARRGPSEKPRAKSSAIR